MITAKGLSRRYGDTLAVDDVSFEIARGEVAGFLGPNGAGKTTTLRMLSGFLPPTSGTAMLGGHDVCADPIEVRRRIGYLPENNPVYEDMEVAEYLEWTADLRGFSGRARTMRVRDSVESCGLGDVLSKPIGLLSKGFRQRTGLAAAILHDPEILLLDEPTSGLDPNQTHEVRQLIQSLKKEKTVLLSTHILPEVQASCDRVLIIRKGRIAASGSPADLIRAGGAARVRVKLRDAELSAVREGLKGLAGAADAEVEEAGGELDAWVAAGDRELDLREAVFRLAVKRRWTLLELRREEASLESVFRELTL